MGLRARRAGRGMAALMAVAVLAVVAVPRGGAVAVPGAAEPVAVAAYDGGFRVESRTTYALDPPGGAVHVAYDVTLTNQRPDVVEGAYIRQLYLPDFGLPVLSEALNVVATKSDGTPLPVRLDPTESPRFAVAVVDLQPNLYYPRSQSLHVTFDLPHQSPRSDGFTRLNGAYATFPTIAVGDPGITAVEILVPDGFEVELVGDEMVTSERDGLQVFTAEGITDPDAWQVLVSARDDSKLVSRTVPAGDEEVDVLGWPDDPEWADFAAAQVEDGVPVLEDLIGIDWPASSTIDMVETASPYLYGYAGWYRPDDSVIEVGDELDEEVMLHELSHLWFNDDLFTDRWINEGFAEQLASMAVAELGGHELAPEPIQADDPGRLTLNDWSDPDPQAAISDEQERYGYNTSWSVIHDITAEVGPEELAAVIQAADAGTPPYQGPGDPDDLHRTYGWKELLDLFAEVAGSTTAEGLFEQLVVSADDAEAFASRTAARERYADLAAAGDGWVPPAQVRLAMSDWRFSTADDLIDEATAILDVKAGLDAVVADLEVDDHLALQDSYESSTDLFGLADEADAALASAEALRSAEDAQDDGAGPLGVVGLLFSGVGDDLARAQRAFEAGDYDVVESRASAVESAMDGAAAAGALRLVGLLLVLALAVLVWRWIRARRRRRRALRPDWDGDDGSDPVEPTVVPDAPPGAPPG